MNVAVDNNNYSNYAVSSQNAKATGTGLSEIINSDTKIKTGAFQVSEAPDYSVWGRVD